MIGPGPKRMVGKVVSTKMQKSVVVDVTRRVQHYLYDVTLTKNKKFMAHDEAEMTTEGDIVEIVGCRPLSRRKFFTVTKVVKPINGSEPFEVVPLPPFQRKPKKTEETK